MVKVNDKKWAEKWEKEDIYSPNLHTSKHPFYNLMMFPYPSAEGMHVGNMYAFTGADIHGRFKRMQGNDVFEPIGLDGFGIHSENYAIKIGKHPKDHAKDSEKNFYRQLSEIGNGFAWDYRLETYDPDYYKWTQWLFIQMFKAGLAYKGKAMVNWCPSCKTVLADEQVLVQKPNILSAVGESHESKDYQKQICERCGTEVEKREMSSWFFRITKYADRLLAGIEKINWPEKIKTAQRNWIGKSEGRIIKFRLEDDGFLEVFTTRPDTLNAVTFLAIADEKLYSEGVREKIGEFTGKYAQNPLDGRKIPVWKTNYVTPGYGTGAIMGVPAHDERDMDFAKKYQLDIINKEPKENTIGEKSVHFHLRDWLISRQRYWGPPIPMIFCETCAKTGRSWGSMKHESRSTKQAQNSKRFEFRNSDFEFSAEMAGWFPVPEEDLPVLLPDIKDFKPKGDGTSPLHNAPDLWKKVKCPNCGKIAERELDVSDTFLDSAWYFLRYPSTRSARSGQVPWDPEITKKWLPVNAYIGGAEHAVLHLLYSRFVWMMLRDNGFLAKELGEEPFPFLYGHGLIIKDGAKMSKSRGNIVVPDEYIEKYGADALRCYLMFLGPYDQGGDFRDTGIEGMSRFMNRVWKLYEAYSNVVLESAADSKEVLTKMHQTIKRVTEDVQGFRYNTAIAKVMEFVNLLYEKVAINQQQSTINHKIRCAEWDEALQTLCLLLAPFAPFMAEEIWQKYFQQSTTNHQLFASVHTQTWPTYKEDFLKVEEVTVVIQVNGKLRATLGIRNQESGIKEKVEKMAKNDPKVAKWLEGKRIKKAIFVPGKIINFVTN